ncbi:glycosyltransferase family 9 protein [Solimonas soli]|uniref:glycosyltransferase family 9 protein n=1 Tax=Solimonas soli TaxID=413479 RepID=UPI0004B44ED4|nr:glycosyltransferase family 9 protein [Solimonas soli]
MPPRLDAARLAVWRAARRILCVRTDNLGDVLMTTPALRALREAAPGRHLTLLASRSGAAAAAHIPQVDEAIVYDAPWAAHPADAGIAADESLIARLRAGRYDAAVIFTVFSQSPLPAAMLLRLAGIPTVAAHCRENPYRLISDRIVEPETGMPTRHEVQRQLDLVAALGAGCRDPRLSFRVDAGDRATVAALLREHGIAPGTPWLLVHPGASATSRRYPPELFAAALRLLRRETRLPIVFGGTPEECATVDAVRAAAGGEGTHSFAGRLTLGQCGAAIAAAGVLIGNNSGPVHLAAALGTPVVDLYAQTNPQHTPWQVPSRVLMHDVDCRWCYRSVCPSGHHACLRGIEPRAVADAALELLATRQPQAAA